MQQKQRKALRAHGERKRDSERSISRLLPAHPRARPVPAWGPSRPAASRDPGGRPAHWATPASAHEECFNKAFKRQGNWDVLLTCNRTHDPSGPQTDTLTTGPHRQEFHFISFCSISPPCAYYIQGTGLLLSL
uniref:Uncharacterized protein n=1 Tax=Molossus molossus TaxID=27622 RepID=A0A7J8DBR6_MOLMO|nr:hypothetical protein HJG59_009314 [Molossus molossus]